MVGLARPTTPRDDALRVGAEHGDSFNDGCNHVAEQQNLAWQNTLHGGGGAGTVALSRASEEVGMTSSSRTRHCATLTCCAGARHVDQCWAT